VVWILLICQILLLGISVLLLFSLFLAMAAMAAGIEGWPFYTDILLVIAVGCLGIIVSRKYPPGNLRGFALVLHGSALGLCFLCLSLSGWSWFHAYRRRFLLPDKFQGTVTLFHSSQGVAPNKTWWRTTYRIPSDGILVTSDPPLAGGETFIDEYLYVKSDGRFATITDVGPGTLADTTANRGDDSRFIRIIQLLEAAGMPLDALLVTIK